MTTSWLGRVWSVGPGGATEWQLRLQDRSGRSVSEIRLPFGHAAAAVALLHQTSRGIPCALNNLAIQALVAAYADEKAIVDESSARAAVTEITAE